jgi:site-specific DNA-cytosine methylase
MNVLSLFDGMSCGQVALHRVGLSGFTYYASEIDKFAIKITQKNFPNTIQLGDVTSIDVSTLPNIDLLIGGSPCQGFSFAGKKLNFNDPRSKLFFEYVRILKAIQKTNPDVHFLLENVNMKEEYRNVISEQLGVQPIKINSNLVSAQNRVRLYWTNIPNVCQPTDKKIFLKDILEDQSQLCGAVRGRYIDGKKPAKQCLEIREDQKTNALTTVQKDNIVIRDKSKCIRVSGRYSKDYHEWDSVDNAHTRKLTVKECERLQTLPDDYTEGVSTTQRFKMIGNGWTVDVIAHLLKGLVP